jgi:hypothetical protein
VRRRASKKRHGRKNSKKSHAQLRVEMAGGDLCNIRFVREERLRARVALYAFFRATQRLAR